MTELVPATRLHLEKLAIQIAQKLIKMVGQTKHVHYLIGRLCHHLDVPTLGGGKCVAKDKYQGIFGGKSSETTTECFKWAGHPGEHLGNGPAGLHSWGGNKGFTSDFPNFVIHKKTLLTVQDAIAKGETWPPESDAVPF